MYRGPLNPDDDRIITEILNELEQHRDDAYSEKMRRSFGIDVAHGLGVRVPVVRRIAHAWFGAIRCREYDAVLRLCERLLETEIHECRTIAFDWAYRCRRLYREDDFDIFSRWLFVYVEDWSSCDDLCTHILGDFIMRYPGVLPIIRTWTHAENRWVRRGSAVVFIVPAKQGMFLPQVLETATLLMDDRDDLVQKGAGWMLKAASLAHPDRVYAFILDHRLRMPRTMLRYAIEKLPPERRKEAMERI